MKVMLRKVYYYCRSHFLAVSKVISMRKDSSKEIFRR